MTSSRSAKENRPKTKVVVRNLPTQLTEEQFKTTIEKYLSEVDFWYYVPGKSSDKHPYQSLAFLNFKTEAQAKSFLEQFNGHTFITAKGRELKAGVEIAACQKLPRNKKRVDPKEGSIETDPEYLQFVESLNKPEIQLPSAEEQLDRRLAELQATTGSTSEPVIVTPLMEYLRNKRAHKHGKGGKMSILKRGEKPDGSGKKKRGKDKNTANSTTTATTGNASGASAAANVPKTAEELKKEENKLKRAKKRKEEKKKKKKKEKEKQKAAERESSLQSSTGSNSSLSAATTSHNNNNMVAATTATPGLLQVQLPSSSVVAEKPTGNQKKPHGNKKDPNNAAAAANAVVNPDGSANSQKKGRNGQWMIRKHLGEPGTIAIQQRERVNPTAEGQPQANNTGHPKPPRQRREKVAAVAANADAVSGQDATNNNNNTNAANEKKKNPRNRNHPKGAGKPNKASQGATGGGNVTVPPQSAPNVLHEPQ